MDIIAINKALTWIVIILAVLNIVTITTFWVMYLNRPKPMQPPMFAHQGQERLRENAENFLDRELNLTKEQSEKFKQLQEEHFKKVGDLFKQIHEIKKGMMDAALSDNPDKAANDKNIAELSNYFSKIEMLNFEHFGQLKSLLNPEQQKKMKEIFKDMEPMMGPPPMGHPGMMPPPGAPGGMRPPHPDCDDHPMNYENRNPVNK